MQHPLIFQRTFDRAFIGSFISAGELHKRWCNYRDSLYPSHLLLSQGAAALSAR